MNDTPSPGEQVHFEPLRSPPIQKALLMLLEGDDYAHDLQLPSCEFAVDLATLLAGGSTPNALKWLICRGFMQHAEVPGQTLVTKDNHATKNDTEFAENARFILTVPGAAIARRMVSDLVVVRGPVFAKRQSVTPAPALIPTWDRLKGELHFQGRLVKRFRKAASNQRTILDVFQSQGWPEQLPDPLPHLIGGSSAKQRLHDTIKNLNRDHDFEGLRFYGTDAGHMVGWKPLA